MPGSRIQERWKLVVTLGVTLLVAYYDRLNISLAMPLIAIEYGWTDAETADRGALLMGLFYAGYGVANIFLSPLGERFGPRRSLLVIIALWSLFTALGAILSQVMALFMASRVLLGLSEGIHFPMMNQLTNRWFAPSERSRANSVWIAGLFLAILTAPLVLVPIMNAFGWRAGFHVMAVAGVVISMPLVLLFVYDKPSLHPRIGQAPAREIESRASASAGYTTGHTGWRLLINGPFRLLLAAGILNNMVALGIASWLPTYLAGLDGVDYGDLSHLAAAPYAASLFGLAAWAVLGDRTERRATIAGAGYVMAGLFAVLALATGGLHIVWATVLLLSVSVFFVAAFTASEFALVQRVVPRTQVASGVGLYNGITTMVGGGLGPLAVGGIVEGGAGPDDLAILLSLCLAVGLVLALLSRRLRY